MKFLKLGLIFAIFVALIMVVINWKSIVSPGDYGDPYPPTDKISVEDKCNTFRRQWANAKGWDQSLYERQINQLNSWKEQQFLSKMSFNTVATTVREQSISKVVNTYKALLSPEVYSHDKLIATYEGVKYLKGHEENVAQDFQETDGIHSLYLKIRSFVGSPHTIRPSFNSATGEWSSFAAASNKILSTAASYRNNKYYSRLKDIPRFREGLSEANLKSEIAKERRSFYASLTRMIVQAINSADPTEENYNKMKGVYERFAAEDSANAGAVYSALKSMKGKLPSQ